MKTAQTSIDVSPNFALGYLQIGWSRLLTGGAAQAIESLQPGLHLSPHDPRAFMWLQFLAVVHFSRV